jgi:anti-sigma regulatory factor (Ser/Thr protein kinase)
MHNRRPPGHYCAAQQPAARPAAESRGRPVTNTDEGYGTGGGFRHEAVYYHEPGEYQSAVLGFVRGGLAQGRPVLVAVPSASADLIAAGLDGSSGRVKFADMSQLGRNPGRIISAVWDFLDQYPGEPVRFVAEPVWPGRSAAELREAALHEAMVNRAFAAVPVDALCAYDTGLLAPRVIASAARTHPFLRTSGVTRPSSDYAGERGLRRARPLPAPPDRATRLAYTTDLRAVRGAVAARAEGAGLTGERLADLIIAVSEVAANTARHTSAGGTLSMWQTRAEVICEISDQGRITDPLVGRRRSLGSGGLGLWVVHQLCDLVELRTGPRGTRIRLHMGVDARTAPLS